MVFFIEFMFDYGDDEINKPGKEVIEGKKPKEATRKATEDRLKIIEDGERNLRF